MLVYNVREIICDFLLPQIESSSIEMHAINAVNQVKSSE